MFSQGYKIFKVKPLRLLTNLADALPALFVVRSISFCFVTLTFGATTALLVVFAF